jgi:hypothetical protein
MLDANAITYLIKQLGRCVFISHNKIAINGAMLIISSLTDCLSHIIRRQLNFNIHLKRCLLYVKGLTLSPTIRFSLILAALVLTACVGVTYWPSGLGLGATLIALLLLLPLTLVSALDAVRYLKSRSPTPDVIAVRIALSLPLVLLAILAVVIGIAFAIFLGAKWSSESPRLLISGLFGGAMFLGFGVKLLQVLWSRKHDKTIPNPAVHRTLRDKAAQRR